MQGERNLSIGRLTPRLSFFTLILLAMKGREFLRIFLIVIFEIDVGT
jgi:hypothetical protein